jgi:hypothetical protein
MFKHGLQNCTIQPECVVKLLAADSAISSIPGTQPENVFVEVVIEEVINYLTATRSNKDTLLTLLEVNG